MIVATDAAPAITPAGMDPATALPPDAADRLAAYLDLLAKWNRVYNLTAIRDREQMESHHIRDALAVLPHLPGAPGIRLLDVGSGGGIPGIPLAIARPDWHVVLLDSNDKKAAFLTQAAIELRLGNVTVVARRVQDYAAATRFDVVISRAFSDLAPFARAASRFVGPGGIIVAMKGVLPRQELDALPDDIDVITTPALRVPGLDAERHLVILRPSRRDPA